MWLFVMFSSDVLGHVTDLSKLLHFFYPYACYDAYLTLVVL